MNTANLRRATAFIGLTLVASLSAHADCNANIPATKPDSLYTDHGDGTITDQATGLMWRQCSEGLSTTGTPCDTGTALMLTWQQALQHADTASFAGYTDWRLPNKNELASLVEYKCFHPSINSALFPKTMSSHYWSSSPSITTSYAFKVQFTHGFVSRVSNSNIYFIRLVRAGQ